METALRPATFGRLYVAATLALGACAFSLGFFLESFTVKGVLIAIFGIVGAVILSLPYRWAIRLLFVYLGFEGMFKIITGYNPAIHIGSDLLVCALTVRWFLAFLLQRERIPEYRPPLLALFGMHFVWFAIEFLNPYALGLIPSLAGAKMYVTMLLLYGYGYYLANDVRETRIFLKIWVFTACVQIVTGLYQGAIGPASVLSLSPGYARPLQKYVGYSFRPFGTTQNAGGAAELIHMAMPFIVYFVMTSRAAWKKLAFVAILPLAATTMALCQVRVAIFKSIIGIGTFLLFAMGQGSAQTRKRLLLAVPAIATLLVAGLPYLTSHWVTQREENAAAIDRSLSLFDFHQASNAREGALGRIMFFATEMPLGAGASRSGAAVEKFRDYLVETPFYQWEFFGDNFWASTISEMGIPGAIILTLLVFGILLRGFLGIRALVDPEVKVLASVILCSLGMLVTGFWGGEAILYNPEAAFFWFFSGTLMRLITLEQAKGRPA